MLLSMAQSNSALFQMISDRVSLARQLDKLRKLKELMETSQEALKAKQAEDWRGWIARYRSDVGRHAGWSDCNRSKQTNKQTKKPTCESKNRGWRTCLDWMEEEEEDEWKCERQSVEGREKRRRKPV